MTSDTDRLPRRLVTLAATALHARVADCEGATIHVWREGRVEAALSAGSGAARRLPEVLAAAPRPPVARGADPVPGDEIRGARALRAALDRCRDDRRVVVGPLDVASRAVVAGAGLTGARWLAAVPVPEADAVVAAWLRRAAVPDDVTALEAARDLVVDTVAAADDVRDHLVVPPTRLVIEQAKGVLMAHHGLGPDEAFALLRSVSQQRNVPVRDLAHVVVSAPHVPSA